MGWPKDDLQTDKLFDVVYDQFIKEIDAIDNGNSLEPVNVYTKSIHLTVTFVFFSTRSQHVRRGATLSHQYTSFGASWHAEARLE